MFHKATKVDSGIGLHLMKKMGWTPGEGLGKHRAGAVEPLTLDIKSDRKGNFNKLLEWLGSFRHGES